MRCAGATMVGASSVRCYNAAFIALAFLGLAFALFPGRFNGDSIGQYQTGLAFTGFYDAHSVLDAVLIGVLSDFGKGPGPVFILQLVLYCGGLLVFTDALIEAGHPIAGQLVSLLALSPPLSFDYFEVQSDALLSSLLLVLAAFCVRVYLKLGRLSLIGGFAGLCVLVLALDTRLNALFVLLPLCLIARPVPTLKLRTLVISLAVGLVVLGSASAVRSWITGPVLKAGRSHLVYALIIYDLAGITARVGRDASEGMLPDFPANVARCYTPHQWDAFQGGIGPGNCLQVAQRAQQLVADRRTRAALTRLWLSEIAKHPLAYAAHRARSFGCLVRLGCYDVEDMSPGFGRRPWDPPEARLTVSARALAALAHVLWAGPLGYGVLWIAVLAAELAAATCLLRRASGEFAFLGAVLAGAGLLYLSSFAVFGVADELRYLHPVILLALVTAPITASALAEAAVRGRSHRREGKGLHLVERFGPDAISRDEPSRTSAGSP